MTAPGQTTRPRSESGGVFIRVCPMPAEPEVLGPYPLQAAIAACHARASAWVSPLTRCARRLPSTARPWAEAATDSRTALGLVDNAREQSFLAARLAACEAREQGRPIAARRLVGGLRMASWREGDPTRWAKPKGHLLPFCSHITLKHRQRRGTWDQYERSDNCSSFWAFFARSEGCRHSLKATHNPKVLLKFVGAGTA